ncbi:hypothetical protein Zmor_026657 [Zophobas morio]|uniref:Uncharacterized protein n=1 Tax=Zophobas morio TaxID=2755281 RepID=A0AA38HU72_9CUCU|nr:hypothetical protein Zmor_026657 [Zophobas morio]
MLEQQWPARPQTIHLFRTCFRTVAWANRVPGQPPTTAENSASCSIGLVWCLDGLELDKNETRAAFFDKAHYMGMATAGLARNSAEKEFCRRRWVI